jgi:Fic family protein
VKWNWQQSDWPHFRYDKSRLDKEEGHFLHSAGLLLGVIKHLDEEAREKLRIELIANEALQTSAIEGEILDRDSVQSSLRRQFGLHADNRKIPPAEQGIAQMMVDLYRTFDKPLTHKMLHQWHQVLMKGRTDMRDIGHYRTHEDAMQVVSGRLDRPKIHFEAPPSSSVPKEMDVFVEWFNRTAPGGATALAPIARAGIAHLYFVAIHPFEDGNGRIGRAVSEKVLAQSLGRPTLLALADAIKRRQKEYYRALEETNKRNEITSWLVWFAGTVVEAQHSTEVHAEFLIEKAKMLDRLRDHLNPRQEKVLLRMFQEGPEGFKGGMSSEKYIQIAPTSPATATRDLQDLVEKGALLRKGELRHTRYFLPIPSA